MPSSLPRPTRLECFKVPPADRFSMDPLSITAAVNAIATAAAQISKAISRLRAFGDVPTQVYAIKNEVSDLEVVLRQVGHAIEQGTLAQNTDRKSLQQTLDRAKTDLADLARALQRVADACDGSKLKAISKTLVWAREKDVFKRLHDDIRRVKATLTLVLGVTSS